MKARGMKARKRLIGAATALLLSMGAAVGLAPSASAFLDIHFVANADGTVTFAYPNLLGDHGVYICPPSTIATDLSECNDGTALYGATRDTGTLAPSPATLFSGMAVVDNSLVPRTLPAGHYTLIFAFYDGHDVVWAGGRQNVYIGPVSAPIPPWVQAVGRGAADSCPAGWGASWQQWAVSTTGGYVCTREIPSLG